MDTKSRCFRYLVVSLLTLPCISENSIAATAADQTQPVPKYDTFSVVKRGSLTPPRIVQPCKPGSCPFAGKTIRVIPNGGPVALVVHEVKEEFEAATGAKLEVEDAQNNELFAKVISDFTNRTGRYDVAIAAAWWLAELVTEDYIVPYDKYYNDPRFPKWDIQDVLPAQRTLLSFGGKKYMVANDHDGQIMYYRRDLIEDPQHQAEFKKKYGYPLSVPKTWDQFRDVAEYFNGKDLNGDGIPDHGLSLHLRVDSFGMFQFMSLSAPFVIGPDNRKLYWFDPETMKPLIDSPGHVRALKTLIDIIKSGPKEMRDWDVVKSWDYFLLGRAALTFTWGDLGARGQQEGSKVKGKIGSAHMPGTNEYYSIPQKKWIKSNELNWVGNVSGASWAGVISKDSKSPEAAYYLLSLLANKNKSLVYAARGSDGNDPGRYSHFLPPDGSADIADYLKFGWNEADVRDYLHALFETYSNELQLPYLRVSGAFSYWQALDLHLTEAVNGQLSPEAALKSTAVDFEEITIRLGRDRQKRAYKTLLAP